MTIGRKIRELRKKAGISQNELGKRLQISQQQIAQYESGKRAPKIETVEKIARALGVSVACIMEEFSMEQYEKTEEYRTTAKTVNAYNGIIAIVKEIYGDVVEKSIDEEYGESFYYLVGAENQKFVLYEDDINQLLEYVKTSIPFVIDGLKDTRPEQVIIDEIKADLSDPEYIAKIKSFIEK